MTLNKYGYKIIGYKKNELVETIEVNTYKLLQIQDRDINHLMNHVLEEIKKL